MTRQLPSLNGLRAFEAAGRHGSFKAAAHELNVTQTAVSHMVRLLEEHLGFALFRRHANRLELTDQGRAFQPGLTGAFDAIARLTEQVGSMRAGPVLTVGVAPAFALHWLIPRLADFNRNHPDVEVRVATGGAMLPLRDDWTCTIRRGKGDWLGYTAEELFPSTLVPVCTPAIAAGLRHPRDLHAATLIVVSHLREQWAWWFEAAGLPAVIQPANEVSFESSVMAIQAALDGVGVAVAQLPYVSDALAAGRLVAPFPITGRRYEGWYLAYRPIREGDSALLAFRNWLHGEAELQRQADK
ncbi:MULTISPECIES: LysR substrate-binding domain-containing protein [unclassified Pseudomonas]|uniref:LysR substrate-binding domain-containing protein n=3 Tax=unclassified Pseudomonas TaxID=196821 RepID=UPI000C86E2ED|nr:MULTISPECIES: LysR substrate-binding domain-containing protein [unclassified Pseudomonas]PMU17567.1 LysR family transcriptional regulator [Pseudomonas sp. GP01-A9]PMU27071.1 LysR family transcriptional regulator [Pseudomonas sp. GP01-A13]PMU36008.1 LysR family transcriptional regulator [Pseudomonas sp. GP01-A8]PMU46276.1 LysR family transcriptional regulator [Pseudomonas sp. GP01-A14]PMU50730.1 LysR family transcriptional regulator [Pseudomonas sp. GP01-A6]